jgi:hypothetical protein
MKAMTETERDADHIRRALSMLLILCGDDGADDADRVMLALAHDGLESLLNRIATLEAPDRPAPEAADSRADATRGPRPNAG